MAHAEWWFVLRDGDICQVQLLDQHGTASAVATFEPGASALLVGDRSVPDQVLRLAEQCGPGDGKYVDSAGRLLDWMGQPLE